MTQDSLAGLVWGGPGWQRLHGEELLAALHGVDASAGQCEGGGGPGDAHAHGHNERLGHVTQLLHRVWQQSLEHTPALPYGLRDEIAGEQRGQTFQFHWRVLESLSYKSYKC